MDEQNQSPRDNLYRVTDAPISRRAAVGASGLAFLGLLAGSALGQEEPLTEAQRKSMEEGRQKIREMLRQSREAKRKEWLATKDPEERAFWERIDNASSTEETLKITRDWHVQRVQTQVNKELGISAEEWAVIQPRLAAVLNLSQAPLGQGDTLAALRVAQGYNDLMVLLQNKEAKPPEIKAKLTALRAAREQARQELSKAQKNLRQLMTLRQEAVLVLNGLLD